MLPSGRCRVSLGSSRLGLHCPAALDPQPSSSLRHPSSWPIADCDSCRHHRRCPCLSGRRRRQDRCSTPSSKVLHLPYQLSPGCPCCPVCRGFERSGFAHWMSSLSAREGRAFAVSWSQGTHCRAGGLDQEDLWRDWCQMRRPAPVARRPIAFCRGRACSKADFRLPPST